MIGSHTRVMCVHGIKADRETSFAVDGPASMAGAASRPQPLTPLAWPLAHLALTLL
jgi:hypothetical protein